MDINLKEKSPGEIYHLMTQTIIPRPIAWILTENRGGGCNLAPFSYFNGICSSPPLISTSIGYKEPGVKKDTWVNIEASEQYVVHIPAYPQAAQVTKSALPLEYGQSELEALGLEFTEFTGFSLPRIAGQSIALGCRLYKVVELGNGPQGLIIGEIEQVYLDESVIEYSDKGRLIISPEKIDPLARLGADVYRRLSE